MSKLIGVPCFLVAAVCSLAVVGAEDDTVIAPFISVTGEGKATAPPDMATIHSGVVTQGDTAADALEQNNAAMEQLLGTLDRHDVAKSDVQTSNFNVSPVYSRDDKGRTEPKVVGYRVQNQVQVHVRNLDSLGGLLDAVVKAGGNQLSGISFGISNPNGVLNEARSLAIRDAKSRADVYAQAAGVEVGRVLRISEQPIELPRPMRMGLDFSAAKSSVPIATGEEELRVTVNVLYELSPAK